jgi:hypothetical protein
MRKIQPKTVAEHPLAAKLLAGVLMKHASQRNDTAVMMEARTLTELAAAMEKTPKMRRAIKAALAAMKGKKPMQTPDSRELMKAKPPQP